MSVPLVSVRLKKKETALKQSVLLAKWLLLKMWKMLGLFFLAAL
jgi:hypothetical protein